MNSGEHILITGAGGFIGRRLCVHFAAAGHMVHGVQRSVEVTDGVQQLVCADLSATVPELPVRYNTVIHAAGLAHVRGKDDELERRMHDVNVTGTRNLCVALERVGVPDRLLFVSSVAVYGCDNGLDIDERHPACPTTPYGRSKLQAEQYLAAWCQKHKVQLTIVRPVLIYGPDAKGNLQDMRRGLASGRYLSIGNGSGALKSIVMVQELVNRIAQLLDRPGIYNICGRDMGFRDIERMVCRDGDYRIPMTIPLWLARLLARIGDLLPRAPITTQRLNKIIKPLTYKSAYI